LFESKTQTEEERLDFLKLKNNWDLLEEVVEQELATPLPNISWEEYKGKILTDKSIVDKWRTVAGMLS
jgi:hypothetical protein